MGTITGATTGTITVEEYERMIEDGTIGEDEQVELIEGQVVAKIPKKPLHRVGTTKTFEARRRGCRPPGTSPRKTRLSWGHGASPNPTCPLFGPRSSMTRRAILQPRIAASWSKWPREVGHGSGQEASGLRPVGNPGLLDRQREGQPGRGLHRSRPIRQYQVSGGLSAW